MIAKDYVVIRFFVHSNSFVEGKELSFFKF
jgi:hypothetical protein